MKRSGNLPRDPRFFRTPREWRRWLSANHALVREQWVGFHKLATGKPSVTYHEALDEALAFGWIDGIRRPFNRTSYVIRFTPRKAKSFWSAVNTRRAKALIAAGRMAAAGLAAFKARDPKRTHRLFAERNNPSFNASERRAFEAVPGAWTFFQSQPPGYRRLATWWVASARREETRGRRLATLVADSAAWRRLAGLAGSSKADG